MALRQLTRYGGRILGGASSHAPAQKLGTELPYLAARAFACYPIGYGAQTPTWATAEARAMGPKTPAAVKNLLRGKWVVSEEYEEVVDPMTGEPCMHVCATKDSELDPFIKSLNACPKHGLHNPMKNPERYLLYGEVSARAAEELKKTEVAEFFARLIMRVAPKSHGQAIGEVTITRRFLENFGGDNVRFLARSFGVPGDHHGQYTEGMRWPMGPVAVITPFNFPLEIPALQMMGALYMGNKPLVKVDSKVSVVIEQFLRLLHHCGMPTADADLIHAGGDVMGRLLERARPRTTLFTGSSVVGERLAKELNGKISLEDAGFDWKILGPDVPEGAADQDMVAWTCDQDAYAFSGQKCSAQSMLLMHENWVAAGIEAKMRDLAGRRHLGDLTVGPVLTVTTERMLRHVESLLALPGARLAWGGKALEGHMIPIQYGAMEPTAVFVPLKSMMESQESFELATTEIFGPLQVITEYGDGDVPLVLDALERLGAHLTAAVVSNDPRFVSDVLAHTVNGTTFAGLRARTSGAPQNHWFGPAGDPRAAGIGSPEAIKLVWSCHREIIRDHGPMPEGWAIPAAT